MLIIAMVTIFTPLQLNPPGNRPTSKNSDLCINSETFGFIITHHHVNVINACNKWSTTLPSITNTRIIQFTADFNNILKSKIAAEFNTILKSNLTANFNKIIQFKLAAESNEILIMHTCLQR
jgi:hypothetical protein